MENIKEPQQPIRVLCVFGSLDRGGAETMCMNLYRHIDRNKIQFDFVKHIDKKCSYEDEIISLGGKVYCAPRFKGWNLFPYLAWWHKHFKQHPEHQIVHGHYFSISGLYFMVAKRFGRITVAHSHHTVMLPQHPFIEKLFIFLCNRYADQRLACSNAAGQFLFGDKQFTVLKNAIEVDRFAFDPVRRKAARSEFGFSDEFVIGIIGRMEQIKNPFGAIKIFQEVHHKNPNARLLWIGDGPLHSEIERSIREYRLENAVFLTGVREDVDALYQAMDLFLFPSFHEGLGIVAIEAQAAGLPCFCSETIPHEVAVTDLCVFLPLNCPCRWADEIITYQGFLRENTSPKLIRDGYDIRVTVIWLEEYYCSLTKNKDYYSPSKHK